MFIFDPLLGSSSCYSSLNFVEKIAVFLAENSRSDISKLKLTLGFGKELWRKIAIPQTEIWYGVTKQISFHNFPLKSISKTHFKEFMRWTIIITI